MQVSFPILPDLSNQNHAKNIFGEPEFQKINKTISTLEQNYKIEKWDNNTKNLYNITKEEILDETITRQKEIIKNLFSKTVSNNIGNASYYSQFQDLLPLSINKYEQCIKDLNISIFCLQNKNNLIPIHIYDWVKKIYISEEINLLIKIKENLTNKIKELEKISKCYEYLTLTIKTIEVLPSKYYFSSPEMAIQEKLKKGFLNFHKDIEVKKIVPDRIGLTEMDTLKTFFLLLKSTDQMQSLYNPS